MEKRSNDYFMNIAPTIASETGMVRLVAEMDGERVMSVDPHIGFSHRGIEKMLEHKNVLQGLCYVDALHTATSLAQEYPFVLAVEKLTGVSAPRRAAVVRPILAELTRIQSHLAATARLASEVGVGTAIPIVVQTSRQIARLFHIACGRYVPSAFFRAGGLARDVPDDFFEQLKDFVETPLHDVADELKRLLTDDDVFCSRTQDIGVVSAEDAVEFGFSGVNLRASGVAYDVRKAMPYDAYADVDIEMPTLTAGDCYARCCLRFAEIDASSKLIREFIDMLSAGDVLSAEVALPEKAGAKEPFSTEGRMMRFFEYAGGMPLLAGEVYVETEAPYGALGVYLVSDGGAMPYRCHLRSAGFPHLQALDTVVRGCMLEDVRPIAASLDIHMPEVDR